MFSWYMEMSNDDHDIRPLTVVLACLLACMKDGSIPARSTFDVEKLDLTIANILK